MKTYHRRIIPLLGHKQLETEKRLYFINDKKFLFHDKWNGKYKRYEMKSLKRMCNFYGVGHLYEKIKAELDTLIEEYMLRKL